MKRNKILVTGFPHTGTSILKSKLGECSNLYECPFEESFIKPEDIHYAGEREFKLVKTPIIPIDIRAGGVAFTRVPESRYYEYIILFVIRNPWNVFTSIIKDGKNPLNTFEINQSHEYHIRVTEYEVAAKFFLEILEKQYKDVYAIKYEDLFPNDFEKFKKVLNDLGLEYTNDIFTTKSKNYIHSRGVDYSNIDKNDVSYTKDRLEYRTWQINQPFQNMNGDVDIPDELSDILENSPIIKQLGYTDPRKTK
jgi:hypothetical protein